MAWLGVMFFMVWGQPSEHSAGKPFAAWVYNISVWLGVSVWVTLASKVMGRVIRLQTQQGLQLPSVTLMTVTWFSNKKAVVETGAVGTKGTADFFS